MDELGSGFWVSLAQIIGVNIVLSGDTAVVMRIALTLVAVELLRLPFIEHRHVGDPGTLINEVAAATGCDLIVMGARGLGSHTGALLGSVAARTLQLSRVPVLVVRG
jgi:Universal stress protein UspA and related nucleotide-binding proteins